MPPRRKLSGAECVKVLCNCFGFRVARQSGSHIILRKETADGSVGTVVPAHRALRIGTIKRILRLAHVDEDAFWAEV